MGMDEVFEDELKRLLGYSDDNIVFFDDRRYSDDNIVFFDDRLLARKAELDEEAEKAKEAAMETEVWDALFEDE